AQVVAAEGVDQLLVDDLDDLLGRAQALGQVEPDALLFDAGHYALDHAEVHVGLEQGESDLAQDLVDLAFAQPSPAAQALEDPLETIGKSVEHRSLQARRGSDLRWPGPARPAAACPPARTGRQVRDTAPVRHGRA